jgi:hypothetical protein
MQRARRAVCAMAGSVFVSLWACESTAAPQMSAAATIGIAGNGDDQGVWQKTGFVLGLRGDMLFLRERDSSFGLGPYIEGLTTTGFADVQAGGGVELLAPVHPFVPVVVSLGAFERSAGSGAGLAAAVFLGSRSYNYHGCYSMSAGLLLEGRRGLSGAHDSSLVAALNLDLELVGLPFLLLFEALR